MMLDSVQIILVWWCQKVIFLEVVLVLVLTTSDLMQFLRPPSELLQCGVQQIFNVELIMICNVGRG